jgi:hypothetical protein
MGGRERRRRRDRCRRALASTPSVMASLEVETTAVSESGEKALSESDPRSCSLVDLFSKTGLEEPFPAAERTSEWA